MVYQFCGTAVHVVVLWYMLWCCVTCCGLVLHAAVDGCGAFRGVVLHVVVLRCVLWCCGIQTSHSYILLVFVSQKDYLVMKPLVLH